MSKLNTKVLAVYSLSDQIGKYRGLTEHLNEGWQILSAVFDGQKIVYVLLDPKEKP